MEVNLKNEGVIEVSLKSGETFYAERGSMSVSDEGVKYIPVEKNLLKGIVRLIGGESFFSIVKFVNIKSDIQYFRLRYDEKESGWFHHNTTNTDIFFIDLTKVGDAIVVPKGSYFASSGLVQVDFFADRSIGRSLFGFGELFKQKIIGTSTVFLQKNRWLNIDELWLEKDKTLIIDPKEVYGFSYSVLDRKFSFSIKNFLAGEGFSSY